MIGQVVGHYRIVDRLGEGGIGVVYLAEDLVLRRRVALKFLSPHLDPDPQAAERLFHEARAAAALRHPNICPVYEIAEAEGRRFIAMAHLEGQTLQHRLAEGPLPPREAIRIARQIGEGLAAAHAAGVIHRDIKPANVMLTPDGGAVLMDFGLARLSGATMLTRTGATMGTLAYMSPEQVAGGPVDPRADIWALGVALFEMVAGRRPFARDSPGAIAYAIVHTDADPLPPVAGTPAGLAGIVAKALARKVDDRYRDMAGLVADLAAIEVDPAAAPAGSSAQARRGRRWRGLAIGSAAALLLVGLLALNVGGVLDRLTGGPAIRSLAVLPLANLSGDPAQDYFADGMTDQLITNLGMVGTVRVISRTSVMGYRGTHKPLRQIARELGVDAIVEGAVARSAGHVRITARLIRAARDQQVWADSYERSLEDVLRLESEVASDITRQVEARLVATKGSRAVAVRTVDPDAHDAYLRGVQALDRQREDAMYTAVDFFQKAVDADPGYAAAYARLAEAYNFAADFAGAPQYTVARARAAALKAVELDSTSSEAHTALGVVLLDRSWDWDAASRELMRAIAINPSDARAHLCLGLLYRFTGEYPKDLEQTGLALKLDPLNRYAAAQLGWAHYFGRNFIEASRDFRDCLRMNGDVPQAQAGLGLALEQMGDYPGAVQHLAIARALYPIDDYTAAFVHALAMSGRRHEAQAVLDSLVRKRSDHGIDGYSTAITSLGLGERERALEGLERISDDLAGSAAFILTDPRLDPLRSDPRFAAVVRRIKLPGAGRSATGARLAGGSS